MLMKFKALFAVVLAVALLACVAAPALAAGEIANGWEAQGQPLPKVEAVGLFKPLPAGVPGISPAGTNPPGLKFATVYSPSVQPKMGDTSVDMTWIVAIAAVSAVGLFVGLKKRAQA